MKGYFKKVINLSLAVLLIIISQATSAQQSKPKQKRKREVNISITRDEILINGQSIELPVKKEKIFELLGQPTRVSNLANTIYTWDENGLFAYEGPESGQIFSFAICLNRFDAGHWPRSLFTGRLIIDEAPITKTSEVTKINRTKKGQPFIKTMKLWWNLEYPSYTVIITKGELHTFSETGKILSVAVSK